MNAELKPCPFCGEPEVYCESRRSIAKDRHFYYFVRCPNLDCQTEGPCDLGKSGAIAKWNDRVNV